MNESIRVCRISKSYGRVKALKDVSFTVAPGEVYGVIGPNGAGKTTLLSIVAGLRRADEGTCYVLGEPVRAGNFPLIHRVGFFSPNLGVLDYLRGGEMILTVGRLHGLSPEEARRRTDELLKFFDLTGASQQFVCEYSQGMRMKVGLACALIHGPTVLLLDEPFTGLDPTAVYRLVHTLQPMAARGKAILVSSHDLGLVERICDRVGILHQGELKEELRLKGGDGRLQSVSPEQGRPAGLEENLWGVVGRPEVPEFDWL